GLSTHKARFCLKCAVAFAAIVAPLQIVVGELSGQEVRRNQPAKLAAIEGLWETSSDVPLVLFAWPDEASESNAYAVSVPHLGSLVLTHSWHGSVRGLKSFAPENRPPVVIPFFSFRIMVALGVLMCLVPWYGLWLWRRGRLFASRRYQRVWMWMMPSGFVALLAGWYVDEVGGQPGVVPELRKSGGRWSCPSFRSASWWRWACSGVWCPGTACGCGGAGVCLRRAAISASGCG